MKILRNKTILSALFVTVIHLTAFGFYDPGLQRWINRDPHGERGFDILHSGHTSLRGDDLNLYSYVANDPIHHLDPVGLQRVVPPGPCFIIQCPDPGSAFVFCVFRCATAGQGVPIGPALCALCQGCQIWVGCPCSGAFKRPKNSTLND